MTRVSDEEREAHRQAAMAAVPVLEKLLVERTSLSLRIEKLQNIVSAYEDLIGKRSRKASASDGEGAVEGLQRGQVSQHIDLILSAGGDYDEPEIRKLIAQKFQAVYRRPTVYTALRRGREAGRCEQKDRRWRMKTA